VLKLYEGYRTLLVDLIRRAQEKGLCGRDFTPEAAAGFLLSALNGSLIEFLFMGSAGLDSDSILAMLRGWLFHETPRSHSDSGKAVA